MLEFIAANAEAIIAIVGALWTALWGFFKGTDAYTEWKSDRRWRYVEQLGEVADSVVNRIYRVIQEPNPYASCVYPEL